MKNFLFMIAGAVLLWGIASCERPEPAPGPDGPIPPLTLQGVAQLFSSLPLSSDHIREVKDAVSSSADHGYDEEYMMCDLFGSPGAGVGSDGTASTRASSYVQPLRDLIRECLSDRVRTRSGGDSDAAVEAFLDALSDSGMQLYWPFSSSWDGETLPVITFDPASAALANVGYERVTGPDGSVTVREITVTEDVARRRPVWVVNVNDDSGFASLEQLRRQDPDWGKGGRVIVGAAPSATPAPATRGAEEDEVRTLILKDLKMNDLYESWFLGAAEVMVKCGSVQGFNASTEAELRLYQPTVTDFMISVKRSQLGQTLPFDAILISDFQEELDSFALLLLEDDGGTRTSWKVDASVKYQSKGYGVTLEIPYNQRDDIIWRGSLTNQYFKKYAGEVIHFGGVDVTFELR